MLLFIMKTVLAIVAVVAVISKTLTVLDKSQS